MDKDEGSDGNPNASFTDVLVQESPDALIALSPAGRILFWNHGAETLFGYGRDEAVGQVLEELVIPPERREEARRATEQVLAGQTVLFETARRRKDGSQVDILSRMHVDLVLLDVMMPRVSGIEVCSIIKKRVADRPYQPVILLTALGAQEDRNRGLEAGADDFLTKPVDRHELLLRVKTFIRLREQDERIRDQVVELEERDQLIQRQLEELRGLDALKDDLVSMMVHDLRNPLSGIVGFLDVVQGTTGDHELRQDAMEALQAGERLREILDDILRVRMLESGVVLNRELLAADTLLRDAVSSLSGAAKARRVEIFQAAGASGISLAADRKLVLRAIENLLSNALKYSPEGATVEAAVRVTSGEIEIEIADRGAGIPDDLKRRLFEKFSSLEVARGQPRRGIGLGLYLVRLVATAHGGRAVVRDREGGGTAFALLLPTPPPVPVVG